MLDKDKRDSEKNPLDYHLEDHAPNLTFCWVLLAIVTALEILLYLPARFL